MRAILMFLEHFRDDISTEMVITPSSEVTGAEDLLVLNVLVRNWENLCAKPEFAKRTCHWIICESSVVLVDGGLVTFDQFGFKNITVLDSKES